MYYLINFICFYFISYIFHEHYNSIIYLYYNLNAELKPVELWKGNGLSVTTLKLQSFDIVENLQMLHITTL